MNMKKTIITILLVLVAMTGQAQSPIPESIVDTYWRNEVTGDWEIGFTESCAIYDCKIWQYGNINEKNGKVVLALNNGNKTLGVVWCCGISCSLQTACPTAVIV